MAKKPGGTNRRRGRTTESNPEQGGLRREQTTDHAAEELGLTAGRQQLERKFEERRGGGAFVSGGDLDAAFEEADLGEETVGGSSPTPDQDVVDTLGEAVGLSAEEEGKTRDLLEIFQSAESNSDEAMEPEVDAEDAIEEQLDLRENRSRDETQL